MHYPTVVQGVRAAAGGPLMEKAPVRSPLKGHWVYVPGETRPYVVRARNNRYAVCTKPHFGTVLYFVLDAVERWRAPEGLVFEMGAESDHDCAEILARVTSGQTELSRRRGVPWDVTRVIEVPRHSADAAREEG